MPKACAQHECHVNNCNQMQMLFSMSNYCERHACILCSRLDRSANVDKRTDGSFFCKLHKCFVNGCNYNRYNLEIRQCHLHMCRLCYQKDQTKRAVDMVCPDSQLCSEHRCSYSKICPNNKSENSNYCKTHSCRECIRLKTANVQAAVNRAPRNTCVSHKLCSSVNNNGKECDNVVNGNSLYCVKHSKVEIPMKTGHCIGKNSKGKPCKSKDLKFKRGIWHCRAHEKQVKFKEIADEEDDNDEEEDNNVEFKANNLPVLPQVEFPSVFTKYICNDQSCNIIAILKDHDETTWSCPIHKKILQNNLIKEKIEETKKNPEPVNEHIVKPDPSEKSIVKIEDKTKEVSSLNDEPDINIDDKEKNIDPDEMDDEFYDIDEMNDELRRLQEQTEIGGDDDEDNEYEIQEEKEEISLESNAILNKEPTEQDLDILSNIENWSWESTRSERLNNAAKCLRYAAIVAKKLLKSSEGYLSQARKLKSEAGAQAFRNARIVGATVVGASRRLEALRAAGPFAVVVEEACEVIEPTLMSVLACNTLRKLELIGDHRQLPAFVQSCWFSFETTMPSIKTSLFERLVSGTVNSFNNGSKV